MPEPQASASDCRIDVWLWRARFFRTRAMATRFVDEGRIRLIRPGQEIRVEKAARLVRSGDQLVSATHGRMVAIRILGLGERRGPASEAAELYSPLEDS